MSVPCLASQDSSTTVQLVSENHEPKGGFCGCFRTIVASEGLSYHVTSRVVCEKLGAAGVDP